MSRYYCYLSRSILVTSIALAIALVNGAASAGIISYYFRLNNADLLGFVSYELPPTGSTVLASTSSYLTIAYPLLTFSFVWNGEQYLSGKSSEAPYVAVRNGYPSVSSSWDDVRLDALTESAAGVVIDAALVFEGPSGQNNTLTNNDLPADLTTWPHLGPPTFRAYNGNTRVLLDLDAEFGFLSSYSAYSANFGADDFVWLGGSGEFNEPSAWSSGKVPGFADRAVFSLAPASGASEVITLDNDAIVKEFAFPGDRDLTFKLGGQSLFISTELVLGEKAEETQSLHFEDGFLGANSGIVVGRKGKGSLSIGNNTRLLDSLIIAEEKGSMGDVHMSGSNAVWDIRYYGNPPLIVGKAGKGTLSILDGAVMKRAESIDADAIIAEEEGSMGDVLVSGSGSQLLVDGSILVGARGQGSLRVLDGGRISSATYVNSSGPSISVGGTYIGSESAVGDVTVEGVGSKILAQYLTIGDFGRGSLTIKEGATVEADIMKLAGGAGAEGSVRVSGAGSLLRVNSLFPFVIGDFGKATLIVEQEAMVWNDGDATITRVFGQDGPSSVLVDGAVWRSGNLTPDGIFGEITLLQKSKLTVQNGGAVETGKLSAQWDAEVALNNGYLAVREFYLGPGGRLSGNGTINGDVVNDGVIAPGNSPGLLRFAGDFMQPETGVLRIELGRGTAGVDYDLIEVTGTAMLGGTLQLTLLPGFIPRPEDTFRFLNAHEIVGAFDQVVLLGGSAAIAYSENGVTLSNVVYTGVPEPGFFVLILFGFLLTALTRLKFESKRRTQGQISGG